MRIKKVSQKQIKIDSELNYLADILVEAFLDHMGDTDPEFIDPRINKPIYDLIRNSKEREKLRKVK